MSRSVAAAVVIAIIAISACGLVVAGSTGGLVPTAEGPTVSSSAPEATTTDTEIDQQAAQSMGEFDTTRFRAVVYENGTVTWTHRHERQLESEEEREEFEAFAEDFENEETPLYVRFTEQTEALIETGTEYTDREMEGQGYNRTADVEHRPNTMGVVEMEFTWTNFANATDDGSVVVGDVFEGGLYIGEGQTLELVAGDDLRFEEVSPEGEYPGTSLAATSSVTWEGEHEFIDGRPHAVLEDPERSGGGGETDAGLLSIVGGPDWVLPGALAAALVLAALLAFTRYRPDGGEPESTDGGADLEEGTPEVVEPEPEPTTEPAYAAEPELMTDEDRVVSLVRENGGRMKQVNIVSETGWSKSKVSMLLSEMETEGTISKLRVGRENIISLEGFEPEATRSPFEE